MASFRVSGVIKRIISIEEEQFSRLGAVKIVIDRVNLIDKVFIADVNVYLPSNVKLDLKNTTYDRNLFIDCIVDDEPKFNLAPITVRYDTVIRLLSMEESRNSGPTLVNIKNHISRIDTYYNLLCDKVEGRLPENAEPEYYNNKLKGYILEAERYINYILESA